MVILGNYLTIERAIGKQNPGNQYNLDSSAGLWRVQDRLTQKIRTWVNEMNCAGYNDYAPIVSSEMLYCLVLRRLIHYWLPSYKTHL